MNPNGPDYQSIKIPQSLDDALRKSTIAYDTAINEFQMLLGCEALKLHSLQSAYLYPSPHLPDDPSHLDLPREVVFKEAFLKLVRAGTTLVEASKKHRGLIDQHNKVWRDENDRVEREWREKEDAPDFATEVAKAANVDDTNTECDEGTED